MANYLAPEDDPVNFLPARVNPNLAAQGRRYNLAERQQTSPLMQAGNVQFAKELASMGNRGSITDLINRGLIANTAGLPVDMLNTVLQTLGLGSEQPLGGSDSIRRALEFYGLSSETQRPMLETLTSLTPPRAVMGAARIAGQGAGAVGRAAAEIANAEMAGRAGLSGQGGAITWHGSPHRFPPTAKNPLGEFDPMKIGTGEGAQSYGVGAGYLAESPAVAKTYNVGQRDLIKSVQAQLDAVNTALNVEYRKSGSFDATKNARQLSRRQNNLRKELEEVKQGSLYKVDLPDEQIAKMLDWDKPLSEQAPEVQAALAKIDKDTYHPQGGDYGPEELGQMIYMRLANSPLAKTKVDASELLKRSGIPGIRYLDQGSRAGGAGTSNFVVFDPKHMNIIGRE